MPGGVKIKRYIVTIFDKNENKRIYYHAKGLIESDEVGTGCLYLIAEDGVIYKIHINDIISIKIKELSQNEY